MAKKSLAMKIENVSMKFNLSSEKVDNIKEYVIKMIKKELMFQEFGHSEISALKFRKVTVLVLWD